MWLLEQSLPIFIIGVVGGAILAGALLQTGKTLFVYLLIGWSGLCALLMAVELVVVTDREKIENTVYAIAAAMEANDAEQVRQYISVDAPELKADVDRQLAYVHIDRVKIKNNLESVVHNHFTPRAGQSKGNVVFMGRLAGNQEVDGTFRTYLVLRFQQDPDSQWRITGYSLYNPLGEQAGEIASPVSSGLSAGL